MKKLLIILSLLIMVHAPVSCFYMDEADTIYPGDEIYTNPLPPIGDITTLTATVSGLTEIVPSISVTFNTPVNHLSVDYDEITGSIRVEYPIGNPLVEGVDYDAIPNVPTEGLSVIYLDLASSNPTSGTTVRVILTNTLNANADNSVLLSNPGNFNRLLP